MSDQPVSQSVFIDLAGDDGVIATHLAQIGLPRQVAPALEGETTHNTVKDPLLALACVNVPKDHFEFDLSFVAPFAKASFIKLSKLFDALTDSSVFEPTPPIAIFGHADPAGDFEYNSVLSARRARSIHAVLTRDVKAWDDLANHPHPRGGDAWGAGAIETMVAAVGVPPGTPDSIVNLEPKQRAVAIKNNAGLRQALYLAYMDALCVRVVDGNEVEFRLEKQRHFLGRGGVKGNGKADMQGCGEFNPKVILSKQKDDAAAKSAIAKKERDAENARNRRVLIFLFKPGTKVNLDKWPCPDVGKGSAAVGICKKRFWPDHSERLKRAAEADRDFRVEMKELRDGRFGGTWACRFYQGIAQFSPCEGISRHWPLRVLLETPKLGSEDRPLAGSRFVALVKDKPASPESPEVLRIHGTTDGNGVLRLPAFDDRTEITLKLEIGQLLGLTDEQREARKNPTLPPTEEEEKGFLETKLDAGSLRKLDTGSLPGAEDGSEENRKVAEKQRLFNLGYGRDNVDEWTEQDFLLAVQQFQRNERTKNQDGTVDDETRERLSAEHEPPREPPEDAQD